MDSNRITLDISKLTLNVAGTIELDRPLSNFDSRPITRSSNRRLNTHSVEVVTGATNPFEFLPSEMM